jgi:hypothetical protein
VLPEDLQVVAEARRDLLRRAHFGLGGVGSSLERATAAASGTVATAQNDSVPFAADTVSGSTHITIEHSVATHGSGVTSRARDVTWPCSV